MTGSVDKSLQASHSVLSDKYVEDKAGGELAKCLGLKVCDQPCKGHLTGRCQCHQALIIQPIMFGIFTNKQGGGGVYSQQVCRLRSLPDLPPRLLGQSCSSSEGH